MQSALDGDEVLSSVNTSLSYFGPAHAFGASYKRQPACGFQFIISADDCPDSLRCRATC